MKEVDNVLRILEESKKAIEEEDFSEVQNLSNQTINTASLTQDPDNIAVAVVIYSLGKIFGREKYRSLEGWDNFYKVIIDSLNKSIEDVKNNDEMKFRQDFEKINKAILKLSGRLRRYIQEVLRKAKINKASKIYEHGVSMEQTAKLLGITMFELANYAGQTDVGEEPESKTLSPKDRIKIVEDIFK